MMNYLVNKFCTHVQELMMSRIIDDVAPQIDIYDNVAVLSYTLPKPMDIEQLMDHLEDDMNLRLIYRAVKVTAEGMLQHICEVEHPEGKLMYKVNAMADLKDIVSEINVTIFSSLDQMCNDLIADQNNHADNGFVIQEAMDDGDFISMFSL